MDGALDPPWGAGGPPWGPPKRLEATLVERRLPPQTGPKAPGRGGGAPHKKVPAKNPRVKGFYLYTTPWEVPEGPACMVPVA